MLDIEEYEWKEADLDIAEKSYYNMKDDFIYIEDSFLDGRESRQTKIQDYHNNRYKIRLKRQFKPPKAEDSVLHSTMDWQEAEAYLEYKADDLE